MSEPTLGEQTRTDDTENPLLDESVEPTDNPSADNSSALTLWWRRQHLRTRWLLSCIGWLVCVGVTCIWFSPLESLTLWLLIAVHEAAHILVGRTREPPIWLPGVGAVLTVEPDRPLTALAGSIATLPLTIAISQISPHAAATCCAFHIVALAPIPPFDGGWVVGRGWWSLLAAIVLFAALGPLALVVACLALCIPLQTHLVKTPASMTMWAILWAAWWGLAAWAPWQ